MSETLFDRLKAANLDHWNAYIHHAFVVGMQDGSLPKTAFQFYLVQDYLFLIQFARAYALAAYKANTLEDLKAAAETVTALTDTEMKLHVQYCEEWGISEKEMQATAEAPQNMAYTRYVMERGMSGDILDLYVALAPCVVGYGEIGARLISSPDTLREENPYLPWIEMYGGDDYQSVAKAAISQLDRLAATRLTDARFDDLLKTFGDATRLEVGFWQMGIDAT
ncbi:thiaminase II [Sneathiella glossodoripedis]|uniref:thiaminase II n=1 Tax=Sneathiella glossodoripedis TaxID=418853 RepID=UPI000561E3B2|nr:thiaminase II [Sneathiella glossodoripedis]